MNEREAGGGRMSGRATAPESIDLRTLARTGAVHFVGIAGAGVSALAELVLRSGGRVTGCDLRPGAVGAALRERGAEIVTGHDAAHVADAVAVVTTAAVPPEHEELAAARARGIPVLKRAEALGALVNRGRLVAVAGTHGKTTTTAMTAAVLAEAGLDPTAFVGGRVPGWGGGLRPGTERLFVVEADEYDRSFLTLRPEIAVITTVEPDHLDIYGSADAVERAFREFIEPVPEDGRVIACVDDAGARRLLAEAGARRAIGYGVGAAADGAGEGGAGEWSRLRAIDVESRDGESRFRVEHDGRDLGAVRLAAPGLHNVRNALAAVAVGLCLGIEVRASSRALEAFRGVGRRFERVGSTREIEFVDDYAHHPTEVAATLEAARSAFAGRRVVAVFQPHLYTRTRDFADEFGRALTAADAVWVADVYPAREEPIPGVTGEIVAEAARRAGASDVRYAAEFDQLVPGLASALRPGDLCLTMGAGNIDAAGREVLERLRAGGANGRAGAEGDS